MPIPPEVKVGPLTRRICNGTTCGNEDDFPSNQTWADEVERVLSHLEAHGQFRRFLPKLRGKLTQRNGALAEARVSFFLCRNGFSITSWEPKGASNSLGEFEIQWKSTSPVFVEVKAPSWEGQLTQSERLNGRKKAGKYQHSEVRSPGTISKIVEAIAKTKEQNKFSKDRPNLLVVYTAHLFNSPIRLSKKIVVPSIEQVIQGYPALGGVLMFDVTCRGCSINYEILFVNNNAAYSNCKLPFCVQQDCGCSSRLWGSSK